MIVFQPSRTQKKFSNPLRVLFWTSQITLSSLFFLLSLLLRKYPRIQLRLTRQPPHLYHPLTTLQMKSQTLLIVLQLDYRSQFRCLKTINLELQRNFLHLVHFYRTLDPSFLAPITSKFSLITLFLDVNIAVKIILIINGERFNQHLQSQTRILYMGNNVFGKLTPKIHDSKHISALSMIGSSSTGDHRNCTLMSLNPLAPAFLPHYHSSSDTPTSLCNSTTMSLPWAQLFCGTPPQIIPSHAPSINQPITAGTFILSPLQSTSHSKQDAAAHQPPFGSSSFLFSSLQHQANCLQAIHKTIRQFNQHLKAEHLDRQTLQLIVLQLQDDFALLRYLLFSPVETISNKDFAVKNSATSPLFIPKPNPNPNATSSAFPVPGPGEPKLRRSIPVGSVGPPRTKTNNSANTLFPAHTQHAGSSSN